MTVTLRAIVCSCQYLQESDPRAVLVLTHLVCTPPTQYFAFQCGNSGGGSGSGRGHGKEGVWEDLRGKEGEELVRVYIVINFL